VEASEEELLERLQQNLEQETDGSDETSLESEDSEDSAESEESEMDTGSLESARETRRQRGGGQRRGRGKLGGGRGRLSDVGQLM